MSDPLFPMVGGEELAASVVSSEATVSGSFASGLVKLALSDAEGGSVRSGEYLERPESAEAQRPESVASSTGGRIRREANAMVDDILKQADDDNLSAVPESFTSAIVKQSIFQAKRILWVSWEVLQCLTPLMLLHCPSEISLKILS